MEDGDGLCVGGGTGGLTNGGGFGAMVAGRGGLAHSALGTEVRDRQAIGGGAMTAGRRGNDSV
ncbi:hypothetical protein [Paenibacillus sp. DMB20]|uniref:hypothetical protein n=1 Tax=Paenibacillus sp. DMB20 TaxID=1642570 RepID=UPI000627910D|nr:hypothetical protein [Paenibacillus sp. DMB20]KKO54119.1 hypothetical protein XI25_08600 [Paenibacillus sp. DMB20]